MSSCPEYALAMAYVPWQHFNHVYEPDRALQVGTIFPELNKPFYGRKGMRS
ncbi:MAG: spore coat associated protein CotJA [Lachnospiraceae bacterium]|nr:spore coat associated protein CotJA [Lachnospiraceae bacterium]MDD7378792.1 spore coat associated protein CotJA [Lachnospiraceae bacterium]